MRSTLFFSLGILLAFLLFWPGSAFALYCEDYPLISTSTSSSGTYRAAVGVNYTWSMSSNIVQNVCSTANTSPVYHSQYHTIYANPGDANVTHMHLKVITGGGPETDCNDGAWGKLKSGRLMEATKTGSCTPTPAATCSDGIQNQGETGIDCGGPCGSCEPATCQNTVMDGDETGINCGGSCDAACEEYCPTDYELGVLIGGGFECVKSADKDVYGNCPVGYTDMATFCKHTTAAILAATQPSEAVITSAGWYELPADFSPGTFNVVSMYDYSTVDNQDGTETRTETVTTTNADGTTSTQTTSAIVNQSTGAVVSQTKDTTGETPIEETPENYNLSVSDVPSDGLIPSGIVPDETSFTGFLTDAIYNNAASGIIENSGITTASPSCSVSATVWGSPFTLDFCNQQITDFLELIGTFVVGFGYIIALFIVFA